MAVAFDAKPTAYNSADGLNQEASAATSISAASGFTVGAGATLLVVLAHWQNGTATITNLSGTWNGVALTVVAQANGASGNFNSSAILILKNPASGAKTLALSWTTASDCYMSAASFAATDTVTGYAAGDTVTGTAGTTVTVTSTTDGATVAVWGTNGSTPTVNFTKIFAEAPLNPGAGASYTLGGTSNAHTFTGAGGTNPAWVGIHVIAAAAGDSTCTPTVGTQVLTGIAPSRVLGTILEPVTP